MSMQRNCIRIEQTRRELERLLAEIEEWHVKRVKADKLNQYHTQLKVLKTVLTKALTEVRTALAGVPADEIGNVYSTCRLYDRRCIVQAIKEELAAIEAGGLGAIGDEVRDLNNIVSARAISIDQAAALGEMSFEELFAQ